VALLISVAFLVSCAPRVKDTEEYIDWNSELQEGIFGDDESIYVPQRSQVTGLFIEMDHPNAYDFSFIQIHLKLIGHATPEDSKIVMFRADITPVDVLFRPDGEIMDIRLSLTAIESYGVFHNYEVNTVVADAGQRQGMYDFYTKPHSDIVGLDLDAASRNWFELDPASVGPYSSLNDYVQWPRFFNWYSKFDLRSVIEGRTVGDPVVYRFSTKTLTEEDIAQPGLNVTFFDCTDGQVTELDYSTLAQIGPKVTGGSRQIYFRDYYYYVVSPYYPQDGTMAGLDEITVSTNGGDVQSKTFITNNLLVLCVEKSAGQEND
jgi:hypothetical protein